MKNLIKTQISRARVFLQRLLRPLLTAALSVVVVSANFLSIWQLAISSLLLTSPQLLDSFFFRGSSLRLFLFSKHFFSLLWPVGWYKLSPGVLESVAFTGLPWPV